MAQTPKQKRPRTLRADIAERTDAEIVERLFGKDGEAELDRLARMVRTNRASMS